MPRAKSMSQAENGELNLDPVILGLLEKLPDAGAIWDRADRQKWIQLLSLTMDLIYKDKDQPQPTTATNAPTKHS